MKTLQTELQALENKIKIIHFKLAETHQFYETCKEAEFQRNKESEKEIFNFIMRDFKEKKQLKESWETFSEEESPETEITPTKKANDFDSLSKMDLTREPICYLFLRTFHTKYALRNLFNQVNVEYLDVQKTWSVYWALNSLAMVNKLQLLSVSNRVALTKYSLSFENLQEGGFSGGTLYHPNIISSYGAVLCLAMLDKYELCVNIDRQQCYNFLKQMKVVVDAQSLLKHRLPKALRDTKSLCTFKLSQNGEIDIRNIYTALVFHQLLELPNKETLFSGCAEYILACQTYEGGIGPQPGREGHGGFTFCGLASLALLNKLEIINLDKLLRWLCNRQMFYEGGFSGRTNKIVDSCYSFWQGACYNIIHEYFEERPGLDSFLYNPVNLYKYILIACQSSKGGFKDKPSKPKDTYHTMYSLVGLGLSVNLLRKLKCDSQLREDWPEDIFPDIDPIFTIPRKQVKAFRDFWITNDALL